MAQDAAALRCKRILSVLWHPAPMYDRVKTLRAEQSEHMCKDACDGTPWGSGAAAVKRVSGAPPSGQRRSVIWADTHVPSAKMRPLARVQAIITHMHASMHAWHAHTPEF